MPFQDITCQINGLSHTYSMHCVKEKNQILACR